ncbi:MULTISPECIES: hypothetical protein [Chryseobacterium]|uniref:hypothetical protein n=1 Tax=Chryseobacterium TaxID=59732 RepID=UPI001BE71988|nr:MULTISPECIES: hypothetical protein [Chryseobacterium]MBT2622498.1 hypothetical protein [Chryseobacterium sp. ISL-6]
MEAPEPTNLAKGTRVSAGEASLWHIHEEHIKYGSIQETRVNLRGRTLIKIMEKLAENAGINGPYIRSQRQIETYQECIDYINEHYD